MVLCTVFISNTHPITINSLRNAGAALVITISSLKRIIVLIVIVMYIETEFYCELGSKLLTVFQSSFFLLIHLFFFSLVLTH